MWRIIPLQSRSLSQYGRQRGPRELNLKKIDRASKTDIEFKAVLKTTSLTAGANNALASEKQEDESAEKSSKSLTEARFSVYTARLCSYKQGLKSVS